MYNSYPKNKNYYDNFNNNGFTPFVNRNAAFQNDRIKKRSGAKSKKYTPEQGANKGHQMIITNGWKYSKRAGLVTYKCNTTSKSKLSDKGWLGSIACEVINKSTGQKSFYWGTMEANSGKVVIRDLGIVINPRGGKGGYTGTFNKN